MKKRIISAVIAIILVAVCFLLGVIPFTIGVAALAALGYLETLDLKESHKPYPKYIKVLGFLCLELIILSHIKGNIIYTGINYASIAITALALTIPTIFDFKGKYTTKEALYLIGTIIFLGVFFNSILIVYTANKWFLIYLLLVATMTDTFAMLIGCLIGKHKLIPKVSPKKSIEGSVAGTIIATIISTVFYLTIVGKYNVIIIVLMSIILSILGQLGDLFFSKIKRENEIKDFSNIMPGHGGILDRLDSLSFIMLGYLLFETVLQMFLSIM